MASCYGWGSTVSRLKPLWGDSLLLLLSPGTSWYSFDQPRKDEKLSPPWSHPVALSAGPLDWGSSALTTRPLLHSLEKKTLLLGSDCVSPHNIPENWGSRFCKVFVILHFWAPKVFFFPTLSKIWISLKT